MIAQDGETQFLGKQSTFDFQFVQSENQTNERVKRQVSPTHSTAATPPLPQSISLQSTTPDTPIKTSVTKSTFTTSTAVQPVLAA